MEHAPLPVGARPDQRLLLPRPLGGIVERLILRRLDLLPITVPDAELGKPYAQALSVMGLAGPHTFHLEEDSVSPPPGLRVGEPADLVVVDRGATWSVTADALRSKGKNTPLLGRPLRGVVRLTIAGGRVAYRAEG